MAEISEGNFDSLNMKVDDLIELFSEMKRENQALKANQSNWQSERNHLLERNQEAKSKLKSILVRLKPWITLKIIPDPAMSDQSSTVQVKILDKEYQVNCPPSDQEALLKSARYLDENMRKIKGRGNIHGAEKIAVMAALNITHDMLRKNRLINETRHVTSQQVKGLADKIDQALATSRQLEI